MIDLIEQQYTNGHTLTELSREFNISKDRIRLHLKKAGLYVQTKRYKIELNDSEVVSLYKQDVDIHAIAAKMGTSIAPITKILKNHNVRKPNWLKDVTWQQSQLFINYDYINTVVNECISLQAVQTKLEIGYAMVLSIYAYHKIPHHDSSADVRSLINRKNRATHELSSEAFIDLYHVKWLPIHTVSQQMGVSPGYLRKKVVEWKLQHLMRDGPTSNSSIDWVAAQLDVTLVQDMLTNQKTLIEIASVYGCCADTLFKFVKKNNLVYHPNVFSSSGERQVLEYITSILPDVDVLSNNRTLIHPFELDVYIPSKQLAIEYCGLYWHSDAIKPDKNYHLNKHNSCAAKNVTLLTIFEDEWITRQPQCKAKIASLLQANTSTKINARQCVVQDIDNHSKRQFLNDNHVQGDDTSRTKLGLFYLDELVAVMTFAKPSRVRNSKAATQLTDVWELNRYATLSKYHVRGGAGKLLTHFKRNNDWVQIYSYADKRWSSGNMYNSLGFTEVHHTKPNYWYVPPGCKSREYRFNYTKASLVSDGHDSNLTEEVIMKSRGYKRIWDCGVLKFAIYNLSKTVGVEPTPDTGK